MGCVLPGSCARGRAQQSFAMSQGHAYHKQRIPKSCTGTTTASTTEASPSIARPYQRYSKALSRDCARRKGQSNRKPPQTETTADIRAAWGCPSLASLRGIRKPPVVHNGSSGCRARFFGTRIPCNKPYAYKGRFRTICCFASSNEPGLCWISSGTPSCQSCGEERHGGDGSTTLRPRRAPGPSPSSLPGAGRNLRLAPPPGGQGIHSHGAQIPIVSLRCKVPFATRGLEGHIWACSRCAGLDGWTFLGLLGQGYCP